MILVTGATGNVGRHLVRELTALGAATRALVRETSDVSELSELGIEVAVGAFEDPDALREACAGAERVFLLSPPGAATLVAQQLPVVAAARASGTVRYVVKLSSIAADEPSPPAIVAAHRRIEEEIEASGVAWTHLRPNWFMQNELGQADSVASDGIFYAPDVATVSMVDARDVAAVAARVLTSGGHEGKAYTLTGPEPLGYGDVAATYSRVLGRAVRWQEVTFEQARASMLGAGLPDELAGGFAAIMRRYRDGGVTAEVSPEVERLLGRELTTFERFIRDHRHTYRARDDVAA